MYKHRDKNEDLYKWSETPSLGSMSTLARLSSPQQFSTKCLFEFLLTVISTQ
jgi:hypothetical protein